MPDKPTYFEPAPYQHGMNELHYAAYCNDVEKVRSAIQIGLSVDARDDAGWTPLHWSIDMSQAWGEPERVVEVLLQAGASPNATDHGGYSVLMMACNRNNVAILEMLLAAGADIHLRSVATTPLHEAAECNFCVGIITLLRLGANPSQLDERGRTPLQVADLYEWSESAAILRDAKQCG